MLKSHLFLVCLLLLVLGSNVSAIDGVIDESLSTVATDTTNSAELPASDAEAGDTAQTLIWPALPDESLNDIARMFYPKSRAMQKKFVLKTQALNTNFETKLKAEVAFKEPTLLIIPTLKSLSSNTGARAKKAKKQKLSTSYNIKKAVEGVPAFLLKEYEELVTKNVFLKAELARLNEKLGILQTKLSDLKLILDKTLTLPINGIATENSQTNQLPIDSSPNILPNSAPVDTSVASDNLTTKKVFKNLNDNTAADSNVARVNKEKPTQLETPAAKKLATNEPEPSGENSFFDEYKTSLLMILGLLALVALASYLIKKHRQRAFTQFAKSIPKMDDTLSDFGGAWQDTEMDVKYEEAEPKQPEQKHGFVNTEMRETQSKVASTLEEAKLLMSINRTQDAIAHLKMTIDAHPKSSINHWLYLLEVFRKLNLQDEFESYAKQLHSTFNVMTPVWYEINTSIYVPQHLEEFPHIMEKLHTAWPSEMAKEYLRSLITDNRDGERAGFSKNALSEILLLIDLLDIRKDLN